MVEIGHSPLSPVQVAAIARGGAAVRIAQAAWDRIAASHGAMLSLTGSGAAIYGVSTGLGAAADTAVTPGDPGMQQRIPLARSVGVGRRAGEDEVRAIMAVRLARLAAGCSGASPAAVSALADLLNTRVHPIVPMTGSVGEADLAPLAHIASVLFGFGEAEHASEILEGAVALRRAGLAPLVPGPKDGLALVSSNAASVGLAALALVDARRTLAGMLAAAALSFEGYRANVSPLLAVAVGLRPVPGQQAAASALMAAFHGGDLPKPGTARRLQDPLSFRCVAPIHGAAQTALSGAWDAVLRELASSDDNPAILPAEEGGRAVPNANFDTTHLALAFEGLGLALGRIAAASGERIMKLMSSDSSGLPRFLSPIQQGRNGFATVQKTVSALLAEIQHRAMPMPLFVMPVADGVEDYATMALSSVEKTAAIARRVRLLAAIELMVAAQARDLRPGSTLGLGTGRVHDAVRSAVEPLHEDRPAAPDIAALDSLVASGAFDDAFAADGNPA